MSTSRLHYRQVKASLSGKLLDFAESLPEVKRGPLHHLQQVRHYQRLHAERDNANPPDAATIKLGSIRLIEAYSLEQFSGLVESLERLFPNGDDFGGRDRAAKIESVIRSLSAGSWFNVGRIVRERRRHLLTRPYRELPGLPVQIRSINVNVEHIMPSLAVLTFDLEITDDGARELQSIHDRSYLGEVTLRSLLKWDRGHSETPADRARTQATRSWVDALRASTERALRPFVEPGLFSGRTDRRPKLPAVEIYLFESGGGTRDEAWERQTRRWLDSYGIGWTYDVYRSDADLFQWPRRGRYEVEVSSHIHVAFREQYRAEIKDPKAYGGEERAILHYVEDGLRALMPYVVLREVLWGITESVQRLREQVFTLVGNSARVFFRVMRNPTSLNAQLLRHSMLLARLKSELALQSRWFEHEMRVWKDLAWLPKMRDKDLRLPEHASEWVTGELDVVDTHLELARRAFGEYFTARNTRAIYWLTIAALTLAAVQLMTSDYGRGQLHQLWQALGAPTSQWLHTSWYSF